MSKIGIAGAGVMGKGIAQVFLEHDYEVLLYDCKPEVLEDAKGKILYQHRIDSMFTKSKKSVDESKLILCFDGLEPFREADFVIEAIREDIPEKKGMYETLDLICKPECIFMSNTSCISITKLGSFTKREQQVIGTHFMNPVSRIPGIEVICGMKTSQTTVTQVKELLKTIGKEAIVIQDYPGFVSNRISHLMMNEAAYLIQDQVAEPKQVDQIFRKCYGHTMGPLETADLIGLDTVVDSLNVLYESYQDSKFRCCPLLKKMVDAGYLGRKSGRGFYQYEEEF